MSHSSNSIGWRWIARQPIVHFLLIGGLLFVVFQIMNPEATSSSGETILVDREAILNFMQYRTNAFEFDLFNRRLDDLTPAQRRELVDEYVREEVLYREALAMGLEQGDYIIRQRMVQKLEFLIEDTAEAALSPTRAELEDFYARFATDYVEPPVYTFTHVFFDAELRGDEDAHDHAVEMLSRLNRERIRFDQASLFGDRPLYFQNYVERTRDFVSSHLGEELTSALDGAEPSRQTWLGPYRSPYGWHLVLLTERRDERLPDLEEIESRVLEDYRLVALDRTRRGSIDQLVAGYDVDVVGLDLGD